MTESGIFVSDSHVVGPMRYIKTFRYFMGIVFQGRCPHPTVEKLFNIFSGILSFSYCILWSLMLCKNGDIVVWKEDDSGRLELMMCGRKINMTSGDGLVSGYMPVSKLLAARLIGWGYGGRTKIRNWLQGTLLRNAEQLEVRSRLLYHLWCVSNGNVTAVPIITQSDPGHENNGVANTQTVIRHTLDPSLAGTMQHRFASGHNNILSEIKWSVFRRDFSPGFENILEEGVREGWYDVDDFLEKYDLRSIKGT
jgi:hypothetical protein